MLNLFPSTCTDTQNHFNVEMPHYMLVIQMCSLLSEICWEEIVWWLLLTACLITIILVNIIHKAANYTWNRFFLSCGWYVMLWCSGWILSKFFTHHGTFLALQCIKQVLQFYVLGPKYNYSRPRIQYPIP